MDGQLSTRRNALETWEKFLIVGLNLVIGKIKIIEISIFRCMEGVLWRIFVKTRSVVTARELFVKTNLSLRPFALVTILFLVFENFFVKTRFVVTLFSLYIVEFVYIRAPIPPILTTMRVK